MASVLRRTSRNEFGNNEFGRFHPKLGRPRALRKNPQIFAARGFLFRGLATRKTQRTETQSTLGSDVEAGDCWPLRTAEGGCSTRIVVRRGRARRPSLLCAIGPRSSL